MKRLRVWAFVFVGVSALAGATVFAQQPPEPPTSTPTPDEDAVPHLLTQLGHRSNDPHFKQEQLYSQSVKLAKQIAKAEKEDDKKDLRKKLADVLSQQFDLHMQQQQKELADLEKQVSNLRTMLKKRQDAKGAIVDRRIDQLAQDAEGLGWSAPGDRHSFWFPSQSGSFGYGFSGTAPPVPALAPPAAKRNDSSGKK